MKHALIYATCIAALAAPAFAGPLHADERHEHRHERRHDRRDIRHEAMKEKWQNATPEEREAMKAKHKARWDARYQNATPEQKARMDARKARWQDHKAHTDSAE